jgi:hypothetical protein
MVNVQGFESAGFAGIPTHREIGVRQALHVYPALDPTAWAQRNKALVLRRSIRGLFAQFIGQLSEGDTRRKVLQELGDIEDIFSEQQKEIRSKERSQEPLPPEKILAMLTPFQRRMFQLLWDHEGIPLSYEVMNEWCSRSKKTEYKKEGGSKVLHASRRNLRKILRGLDIGELFTIQRGGVLFLSPERSGLSPEDLHSLKGSDGIHGLNYDILRKHAPNTTPYEAFARAFAEVNRGPKGEIDPQKISKKITKLNKIDTRTPCFVVQADQKKGYRLFSSSEIPESWISLMKNLKLQAREGDLLVHFLSRDGQIVTPEEILALLGEPGSKKINNSIRTSMFRFIERVQSAVQIEPVRSEKQLGRPIIGYTSTIVDLHLIARPQPVHEIYVRAIRKNLMSPDRDMEEGFASFDPAIYDEWAEEEEKLAILPKADSEDTHQDLRVSFSQLQTPTDTFNIEDDVSPEDENAAWEAAAQMKKQKKKKEKEKGKNNDTAEGDESFDPDERELEFIASLKERGVSSSDPTDAPPGSWQKAAILRRRINDGVELWHPEDAQ